MPDTTPPPAPSADNLADLRDLLADPGGDTFADDRLTRALGKRLHWDAPYCYGDAPVAFFDTYAAAADVLETQAAALRLKFDMSDASGASMKRSQQIDNILKIAREYRLQARVETIEFGRSDVWPIGPSGIDSGAGLLADIGIGYEGEESGGSNV